jgi:26S proteasome regulatory subunit N10
VTIPPGPHILSDILISSPIISGEGMGVAGAMGSTGEFDSFGGIDPSLDPELALVCSLLSPLY